MKQYMYVAINPIVKYQRVIVTNDWSSIDALIRDGKENGYYMEIYEYEPSRGYVRIDYMGGDE